MFFHKLNYEARGARAALSGGGKTLECKVIKCMKGRQKQNKFHHFLIKNKWIFFFSISPFFLSSFAHLSRRWLVLLEASVLRWSRLKRHCKHGSPMPFVSAPVALILSESHLLIFWRVRRRRYKSDDGDDDDTKQQWHKCELLHYRRAEDGDQNWMVFARRWRTWASSLPPSTTTDKGATL